MSPDFAAIAEVVRAACGKAVDPATATRVDGGSISAAWRLDGEGWRCFVKTNRPEFAANFVAEADSLSALTQAAVSLAPSFLARGNTAEHTFLVLEFLPLTPLDTSTGALLGVQLAALHRNRGEAFGWHADNFIGSTPQGNEWHASWPHFFAKRRLLPQLELAARKGMERKLVALGQSVAERIGGLFVDYRPQPSLLHGDLWSGNAASTAGGQPVIFDPACYYGDREADLAMSELFGGFPESFYAAYRAAWPVAEGYETRKTLYNLYHVLNHYHLFGDAYLGQAVRMMERLDRDLRR